jgi:hypothetical protein
MDTRTRGATGASRATSGSAASASGRRARGTTSAARFARLGRAALLAAGLALSQAAAAIETHWSLYPVSGPDIGYWYDNHWSDGLPTALDTAVLSGGTSVADMNSVDWSIGGLVIEGASALCGRYFEGACAGSGGPAGATLTIAPPIVGDAALATRFDHTRLERHTAELKHLNLVTFGRVEVAAGTPLFGDERHHFELWMGGVTWLHAGLVEVNRGGGSGMLTLANSTLGAIGRAPDLHVDAKRFFDPAMRSPGAAGPDEWAMLDADVLLQRSSASFTDVALRGHIGLLDSTFAADTLEVTNGGRFDQAWESRTFLRTATAGTGGGTGTIATSMWEPKPSGATPSPREDRELRIAESLTLGDGAGSTGRLSVGHGTSVVIGTPNTTGYYGDRVLYGATGIGTGSAAEVTVRTYGLLRVHGSAILGENGAASLRVDGGEMIVSGTLDLGNGSETASAVAIVERGGLLQAQDIYVGADYFELNYGDHNPYGSGQGTLTVRDDGVVRVTGSSYTPAYEGAPTFHDPGHVYVGRNDTLNGNGTLEFTNPAGGGVVNLGTVAPGNSPGILTIAGDFTFTNPNGFGASGGRLLIELGGTIAGTEYDVLHVLGDMDLSGGVLELVAIDGFTPTAADVFAFLRVDGRITGSFASLVDHTGLGLTLDDLRFGPGGLVGLNVAAVPEPAETALLLVGLGVVGWSVRRNRATRR